MNKLLIVIGVIILISILVLGWLGFVPGLSTLLGADRPRDLGVKYTQADLQSLYAKSGVTRTVIPPGQTVKQSMTFTGSHAVKTSFTQEELSARLDADTWKYQIAKNPQIKINNDGTVEISGRLVTANVDKVAEYYNLDPSHREELAKALSAVKTNPSFYVKARPSVVNNQVSLVIEQSQIGRLPVPGGLAEKYDVAQIAEQMLRQVNGLFVNSASFADGKMSFDGSLPDVLGREEQ